MKRYGWFLLVAVGAALTMSSWAYAQARPKPPSRTQKAKPPEKPYALGVGVGYVKPEDVDGTFWLVANGRYKFASNLAVEPEIGYWRRSEGVPGLFEVSLSDFSVGGHVLLLLPAADRLQVFVGGGPGVHFLRGAVGFFGLEASETETKFGVHLLGGVEADVAESLAVFGAGHFDLVSEANQFKVYGGLRYKF